MVSVTQILDTFPEAELVAWQCRVGAKKAKEVSEEALRIGATVDGLVQLAVQGKEPLELPMALAAPILSCWQGWKQFTTKCPDFTSSIVWTQQALTRLGIIGHPDFYLKRGNLFGICDLKCAAQIRPSHWTQVAAYSWLQDDETNVDFLAILRLDKERATYEYVELTDPSEIDYEVQIWLNYKSLYQHRMRVAERARRGKEQEVLGCTIESPF